MPYNQYNTSTEPDAQAVRYVLNAITSAQASAPFTDYADTLTVTYSMTGTGAISATVLLQVRNVSGGEWETMATTTLSGTNVASGAVIAPARFKEYRLNCTAISGTSAELTAGVAS